MGFGVYSTGGTADALAAQSLRVNRLEKITEGDRPNVLDMLANDEIGLVINTPTRTGWATDEGRIRAMAVRLGVPMITTASGAVAVTQAIEALRAGEWSVVALQDMAPPATLKDKMIENVAVVQTRHKMTGGATGGATCG